MTSPEQILLPKTAILSLLDLKPTQFDSMKTQGHLPKSIGTNKNAKYDLKAVIQAWTAYQVAQVHQQEASEDTTELIKREDLLYKRLRNAEFAKNMISREASFALLNHYFTQVREALITLEFSWAPELIGMKTEVESMKTLAALRDRMLDSLNDPEDFDIDDFIDSLNSERPDDGGEDAE
jgi:hypothetical protein